VPSNEEYRGRVLPDVLIRQIRRLRRQGMSIRKIAYAVGVSVWSVHKYTRPDLIASEARGRDD